MARRRVREANIFNFSFLDILACTIGALIFILVMVIINNSGMLDASALEDASKQLAARKSRLEKKIEEEKKNLKIAETLTTEAERLVKPPVGQPKPPSPRVTSRAQIRKDIAKLEAEKQRQEKALNKLRNDLDQSKAEVKRLGDEKTRREGEARQAAGPPKVKPIPRRKQGVNRQPIHVTCHRDKVVVYPEKVSVSVSEMNSARSAFRQAIERIKRNRNGLCMVLWVYPDAFETFQAARDIAEEAEIGVGWEPASAGWEFDL